MTTAKTSKISKTSKASKAIDSTIEIAQVDTRLYDALIKSISTRQARQPSKDNNTAITKMIDYEVAIKRAIPLFDASVFEFIIKANSEGAKGDNFIAVKAQVKVLQALQSIGQNLVSILDDYSATIVSNALANNGVIFSKSALVCLSKDITYNELDSVQIIKTRMSKLPSTASTQRSSSREMLRFLQLADIKKGVKGDDIKLTASGKQFFKALFA